MQKTPKLTLIGAGPGDPELITLKGLKALQKADVVLYDALVHPDLVDMAPPSARRVFVGKRAGKHSLTQDEINQVIVRYALAEGHVVRLKGGDPFVFGRGYEEIMHVESFGIATETIVGVSSTHLPGYYGIPLTHRGVSTSFWAMTATTKEGELSQDVFLAARSQATVIFFMGLRRLKEIARVYEDAHRGSLPAAIIEKGSLKEGKVHFATVDTLHAVKEANSIEAPALVVIGETVALHTQFMEQMHQWEEARVA